jgi:hypothetical protein
VAVMPGQVRQVRVVELLRRGARTVGAQVHHQSRDSVQLPDEANCE